MPDAYRFGSAEVRPAERALLIAGAPVALGGRAFDLLVALLERPGRLGYADAGYAKQGQPREPNEARTRDAAWALLGGRCAGQDLQAWLAAGAALPPDAVCVLALEPSADV